MGNKTVSQEDAITRKKEGIRNLNKLLESHINSGISDSYKKAYNISSWINAYTNYLRFENHFLPTKNIAYSRGDIVKVNFGYNVGNELGGIHYAVVIDNNNKHRSGMITVIPLSSTKERVYERDVDLGIDLYRQLNSKLTTLHKNAREETDNLNNLLQFIQDMTSSSSTQTESGNDDKAIQLLEQVSNQRSELLQKIDQLQKMKEEIDRMKTGSIAKIEQITSISKMRILDPKQTGNVLHNISLSSNSMQLINDKIMELFIYSK